MRMYYVVVVDNSTGLQVQRSDPHTWAECEHVYNAYQEEYEGVSVRIIPV